jgi:hypothetical protein
MWFTIMENSHLSLALLDLYRVVILSGNCQLQLPVSSFIVLMQPTQSIAHMYGGK